MGRWAARGQVGGGGSSVAAEVARGVRVRVVLWLCELVCACVRVLMSWCVRRGCFARVCAVRRGCATRVCDEGVRGGCARRVCDEGVRRGCARRCERVRSRTERPTEGGDRAAGDVRASDSEATAPCHVGQSGAVERRHLAVGATERERVEP